MNRVLVILIAALLIAFPVAAQSDATAEPPIVAPSNDITVQDGGTLVLDQTPPMSPVPAEEAPPVDVGALGQFGLYLMLAIAGGGSFALVLTRLDTRGKDNLEKAYLSLAPEWQNTIVKIVEVAEALGKLGREVTDGQPNTPANTPPTP